MPRKGPVTKRDVLPDPVYGSKLLTRFTIKLCSTAKKALQNVLYTMHSTWFVQRLAKILWKCSMLLCRT